MMSGMELAVLDHKNIRQRLSVNHLGNMTHIEKDLDDFLNTMSTHSKNKIQHLHSARAPNSENKFEKTTPRNDINLEDAKRINS